MDYFSLFASQRPLVKEGLLEIYVYEDACLPYVPDPSKLVIIESIAEAATSQEITKGIPIYDAFTGQWVSFMENPEVVTPSITLEQNIIYDPYLKMCFKRPDASSQYIPELSITKRTLSFNIEQNGILFQQVWDMSPAKYRTSSGKTIESSDTTPIIYFKNIVKGDKKIEGPIFSTFQDGDWIKISPLYI